MRMLMVLIGLAAVPLAAAVSQSSSSLTVSEAGLCTTADANRSPTSWANVQIFDTRRGCSPMPPAPPPPPPPPSGGVGITGRVYNANSGSGMSNWTVEVSGPTTASAVSDGNGTYTFAGLPAGTYLVCEVQQAGWRQTSPSSGTTCPSGAFGYRFTLSTGQTGSFVNFGNVPN